MTRALDPPQFAPTLEPHLFGICRAVVAVRALVGGARGLVEIGRGRGVEREVPEPVDAADEHGRRPGLHAQVTRVRGDVADPDPDAATSRAIGLRPMQRQRVVQGKLAFFERRVHGRCVVDVTDDRLPGAVHAAGNHAGVMASLPATLGAGQELHASVLGRRVRQRQPRRHVDVRSQAEVRGVLVPRRDVGTLRLLDEPR